MAIITGEDSGIGHAVAVQFAKEGGDVLSYIWMNTRTLTTAEMIRIYGKEALIIPTDVSDEKNCKAAIAQTIKKFKSLDIVVNNAAAQFEQTKIESIDSRFVRRRKSSKVREDVPLERPAQPAEISPA